MDRRICHIGREIKASWGAKINYAAKPYVEAMCMIPCRATREEVQSSSYYSDHVDDVVLRFLCNAGTWRGDDARRIKAELNALVKGA